MANNRRDNWRMVRLPRDLAAELDSLALDMEKAHALGYSKLPDRYVEHVPLHHVVSRCLQEYKDHLARGRKRRAR